MRRSERATRIPDTTPEDLWAWHQHPEAFERLVPPWQDVTLQRFPEPFEPGQDAVLSLRQGPLRLPMVSRLSRVEPPHGFADDVVRGPFRKWHHEHRFEDAGDRATRLTDRIDWQLPGPPFGDLIAGGWAASELDRLLAHRHRRTSEDLARHQPYRDRRRLVIGVTGATGLVGSALTSFLRTGGHSVVAFSRRPGPGRVVWDPARAVLDPKHLEGMDAVVHLAAEPIADARWTPDQKARITTSRVQGTRLLALAMARCDTPPPVLISASAVGWYGHRDLPVDESSVRGEGFLATTCEAWEAAADPARQAGIRVVHPRIGLVLSARGGVLQSMLPVFRLGLGGPLGSGTQGFPWVALDDLVAMLHEALQQPSWQGPFNAVGPSPMTQRDFARSLGRVLRRPALAPLPAPAVRLLFGELGQALLLDGQLVKATRLRAWGFTWYRKDVEDALRWELGRPVL